MQTPRAMEPRQLNRGMHPHLKITNEGFSRHEPFVRRDIPRTHLEPALGCVSSNRLRPLRAHLKVVENGNRLPVHHKLERRILPQRVQNLIQHRDQSHPIPLKRLIPLPVPVSASDIVGNARHTDSSSIAAGLACAARILAMSNFVPRPNV